MRKSDGQVVERKLGNIQAFNEGAVDFETWFKNNEKLFYSELNALKKMVINPEKCISIGIGDGLFAEKLGIKIGVEPSKSMAELARKRGIKVIEAKAEDLPFEDSSCTQLLLGTILCYVENQEKAIEEAYRVLKKDGEVIVSILPAEGPFALLYRVAKNEGYYDEKISPKIPYPLKFIEKANWIASDELIDLMEKVGFRDIQSVQTLINNPKYCDEEIEEAIPGYKKGSYIVFKGVK
ncbi:type 11 methyltransferase [Petrotoga mexicana DSM 14811]|uniref:Type 11 methyltransferase n=1 Tax=Petrotoga mexicana DSM 14811 TaxID=1122954 RepID=A0A2K1PCD4_9BACT|nr:class I SAM-dependent methyltransferase [Petrotoga mexicana]PNS00440.1 type 11 methyltransferase [Petrotoga mexicana DSM 14811]